MGQKNDRGAGTNRDVGELVPVNFWQILYLCVTLSSRVGLEVGTVSDWVPRKGRAILRVLHVYSIDNFVAF